MYQNALRDLHPCREKFHFESSSSHQPRKVFVDTEAFELSALFQHALQHPAYPLFQCVHFLVIHYEWSALIAKWDEPAKSKYAMPCDALLQNLIFLLESFVSIMGILHQRPAAPGVLEVGEHGLLELVNSHPSLPGLILSETCHFSIPKGHWLTSKRATRRRVYKRSPADLKEKGSKAGYINAQHASLSL